MFIMNFLEKTSVEEQIAVKQGYFVSFPSVLGYVKYVYRKIDIPFMEWMAIFKSPILCITIR